MTTPTIAELREPLERAMCLLACLAAGAPALDIKDDSGLVDGATLGAALAAVHDLVAAVASGLADLDQPERVAP